MLPTIALGIGVVVAGLGIGAFLSALQHGGSSTTSATTSSVKALPVVTPVPRRTRGPVAIATLVAHPTPSPTPKPTPKPSATAAPSTTPRPSPTVTARPSTTPAPTATPLATATAQPTTPPTIRPAAAPTPRVTPPPTPPPATPRPATPRPTAPPTVPPTEVARVAPPQTGFGAQAQATVRRYLDALIAGNENAAYAALGASPGDANAKLSEEAFIDRGTRITSLRTTSTNPSGATVEVEISSSRGSYYATYHVTNGPGGPVIDQHDYIKV